MSSEGSREIEGARNRLAAANSQATAASTNLESIKQLLVHAQSMFDVAEKERKEAKAGLSAAEKRWEVIDIDGDDDIETPKKGSSSNKRRKVSPAPSNSIDFSTNIKVKSGRGFNSMGPLSVTVEGCGIFDINGKYTQKGSSSNYLHNGALVYQKRRVGEKSLMIYRFTNRKTWGIGETGGTCILRAHLPTTRSTPPENGWIIVDQSAVSGR